MQKIILIALCTYIFCFGTCPTYAEEKIDVKDPNTKVEQKISIDQPVETITVEEMERRLKNDPNNDVLFVKTDKNTVDVYKGTANDRSLRKQIVFSTPVENMIRLYTTNKATASQISRMLEDYEDDNANINNYRVIMDIDKAIKLENGNTIYKIWFMKVTREQKVRRKSGGGWNFPIGIGIGIGTWGHHHFGVDPYIGIGHKYHNGPHHGHRR